MVAGGLGVVVVQEDEDGKAYICACASSGLSVAQKNYHIVRLELLALVFACGKFHEWLGSVSFVWRTDCRAHQYLEQSKLFHQPNNSSIFANFARILFLGRVDTWFEDDCRSILQSGVVASQTGRNDPARNHVRL